MKISAYKVHDRIDTNQIFSCIILETPVDVQNLIGILSRDIVLCNRINSGDLKIQRNCNLSKAIIPIEDASHSESDYGFGNVLFDIAMKEYIQISEPETVE
jgi:hypothetical protein